MRNILINSQSDYTDNPVISFTSSGKEKSRVLDEEWDFTALGQNKRKINFTSIKVPLHRRDAQRYLATILEDTKAKSSSGHFSVGSLATYLVSIGVLINHWGKADFNKLSNDREWRDVKISLKEKYSRSTVRQIGSFLNKLHDLGLIDRWISGDEMLSLAKPDSDTKQHIALPQAMHIQLLEGVVETIETYHPYRHKISEFMSNMVTTQEDKFRLGCRKYGSACFSDQNRRRAINAQIRRIARKREKTFDVPKFKYSNEAHFVSGIVESCFIIIALFSGCRLNELLSMTPNSYQMIGTIPTLYALTSKGNEGQPIEDIWTTHPITLKALELAYDVSQYARDVHKKNLKQHYNSNKIDKDLYERSMKDLDSAFIPVSLQGTELGRELKAIYSTTSGSLKFDPKKYFNPANAEDVLEFDLLNPSRKDTLEVKGFLPKFSPHDLRRSFAVFMVRNKLGNLLTIKHQFKHKNLNMAGWYANNAELARIEGLMLDSELMDMCDQAMEDAAVDALDDIYNGSGYLSGIEGKRISKAKKDALRRGEKIYLSRDELRSLIKSGDKSIVLLPTGAYCTNSSCERLCSISYFNPEDKPCDHEIITDKGAKIKAKEHSNLIRTFRGMNEFNDYAMLSILAGIKQKVMYLEKTLIAHNIEFEPFIDEIKVVAP